MSSGAKAVQADVITATPRELQYDGNGRRGSNAESSGTHENRIVKREEGQNG